MRGEDLKKCPAKERMSKIAEKWKTLTKEEKERYRTTRGRVQPLDALCVHDLPSRPFCVQWFSWKPPVAYALKVLQTGQYSQVAASIGKFITLMLDCSSTLALRLFPDHQLPECMKKLKQALASDGLKLGLSTFSMPKSSSWKLLFNFRYNVEVKTSGAVYRKAYDDWLNNLSESDREYEVARTKLTPRKPGNTKVSPATLF